MATTGEKLSSSAFDSDMEKLLKSASLASLLELREAALEAVQDICEPAEHDCDRAMPFFAQESKRRCQLEDDVGTCIESVGNTTPREWSRCSTEAPSEDENGLGRRWWGQAWSRESTEVPSGEEDCEEDEEDSEENAYHADEPGEGCRSAGKINVPRVQKSPTHVRFEDCSTVQEPTLVNWEEETLDQSDHIPQRPYPVNDRNSHGKYFEDASWQSFNPEFAQWRVRSPLRPISEDAEEAEEKAEEDEDALSVCFAASYVDMECSVFGNSVLVSSRLGRVLIV